jgi:uncharacterized protein DUF5947
MISLRALADLTARPASSTEVARCGLCAQEIGNRHHHVVEIGVRGVLCACTGCAILFRHSAPTARYRTVPDRVHRDPTFVLTPQRWAELGMPVGLAFCFRDSKSARPIVCFPGPAGLVDAELGDDAWRVLASVSPLVADLEDDVEALLVHGARGAERMSCRLVPISVAYELVTRLRRHWQGFTGGEGAERELEAFWKELEKRDGAS